MGAGRSPIVFSMSILALVLSPAYENSQVSLCVCRTRTHQGTRKGQEQEAISTRGVATPRESASRGGKARASDNRSRRGPDAAPHLGRSERHCEWVELRVAFERKRLLWMGRWVGTGVSDSNVWWLGESVSV